MQIDNEQLSNIMDGEAGTDGELARLADARDHRATWSRYHLIGDVLRDNASEVAPAGFAERVSAALADEPTVLAPKHHRRHVLKPAVGFAIAASVAAVAVIGIQRSAPDAGDAEVPAVAVESAPVRAPEASAVTAELAAAAEPAAVPAAAAARVSDVLPKQRRLNGYLVKFNEQRSNVGVPGVNPYVRIVGFESE